MQINSQSFQVFNEAFGSSYCSIGEACTREVHMRLPAPSGYRPEISPFDCQHLHICLLAIMLLPP